MSLVGNLEDLSLGDIMQIISLSQKSGVLALEGDSGAGRIVFLNGLVHGATVKGGPENLRDVLVTSGLIDGDVFDRTRASAADLGLSIEEAIARAGHLSAEQIDDALKDSIEAVILGMFAWPSGDFSFDVRSELEPDDPQSLLSAGINAQYLAMEGMRISDEASRDRDAKADEAVVDPGPSAVELDADDPFGAEPLETGALFPEDDLETDDVEVVALEVDDDLDAADILVASVVAHEDGDVSTDPPAPVAPVAPVIEPEAKRSAPESPAIRSAGQSMSVVLIDPDVSVLESTKGILQDDFARIHVFQQAEQGLARIRQYLIRGELPLVLISTDVPIDPLSGIHGLGDFVSRLKTQANRLLVVGLHEEREDSPTPSSIAFDAILPKPDGPSLREAGDAPDDSGGVALADALQQILLGRIDDGASGGSDGSSTRSASLQDLRDTTRRLQEASSRGEILPVVLDFAAERFARVAILIVRAEQVFAIGGRGIQALEVDDPLDSAPPVSLQALDAGWIRQVIDTRKPIQGPASTPADRDLLIRLGGVEPVEAYLGPIESAGSTIALLYADQADSGAEMPDTSGLEVVLQHAGLALDRAALERALWESDAKGR